MKKLTETDMRLVSCYVDGELAPGGRVAFERRLLREPDLREAIDLAREARACLAETRPHEDSVLSPSFSGRVMERVRHLPPRAGLQSEAAALGEEAALELSVVSLGKRVVAAAVLLLGFALVAAAGLLQRTDAGRLEASDRQEIRRLDAEILTWPDVAPDVAPDAESEPERHRSKSR